MAEPLMPPLFQPHFISLPTPPIALLFRQLALLPRFLLSAHGISFRHISQREWRAVRSSRGEAQRSEGGSGECRRRVSAEEKEEQQEICFTAPSRHAAPAAASLNLRHASASCFLLIRH